MVQLKLKKAPARLSTPIRLYHLGLLRSRSDSYSNSRLNQQPESCPVSGTTNLTVPNPNRCFDARTRFQKCTFLILVLTSFLIFTQGAFGQYDPDLGLPDSAYFGEPRFEVGGTNCGMLTTIPLMVYCDDFSLIFQYSFYFSENAVCEAVRTFNIGPSDSLVTGVTIDNENSRFYGDVVAWNYGLSPTNGAEKILEITFSVPAHDTLHIWATQTTPRFSNVGFVWIPSVKLLDTTFHVEQVPLQPGDADCSGLISISDAVFLIQYIFAGGQEPFDLNAADCDASCAISISDAVYLINYIFGGGTPPKPGCAS